MKKINGVIRGIHGKLTVMFLSFFPQCVPYLIAMGTDPEPSMRNKADQQLVEIDKKYAGFIHVCTLPFRLL